MYSLMHIIISSNLKRFTKMIEISGKPFEAEMSLEAAVNEDFERSSENYFFVALTKVL